VKKRQERPKSEEKSRKAKKSHYPDRCMLALTKSMTPGGRVPGPAEVTAEFYNTRRKATSTYIFQSVIKKNIIKINFGIFIF